MTIRTLPLVAAFILLVALVSGCGSSGSSGEGVASLDDSAAAADEDSTAQAASDDPQEAALEWARCMRAEGIAVSDPQVDEDGRVQIGPPRNGDASPRQANPEKFQAAMEKCGRPFGGSGGPPQMSEADREQLQETMLAYAKCMRENGVDMPDPDFSGNGGLFRMGGPGAGIDPQSATFQKAQEACQSILRDAGFRGPGGARGPGGGPSVGGAAEGTGS